MSNLRGTGHLPLKTSMTNKWKSQAPTSELLERQTRALEDSLNKLKLAMNPDKTKAAAETSGPIWERGKSGPLSQYANHVLRDEPRRALDANRPTKIRVLTDEPPATVTRPSLVANLLSAKTTTTNSKTARCGQCEKDEAKMKCLECAESYCAACFAHFHLRGALQRHRCVPLSDSRPATPQKKKTTVGADVIFKELRVAQSKDDLLRNSNMTAEVFDYDDDDIDDDDEDGGGGGELLNGNYDEKTSAASFQQALMQWRQQGNSKKPAQKGTSARKKKKKATHEAAVDTVVDANGELNSKALPNIEFHSSKLTYGEKLLVKKYRRANKNGEEFFDQRATKPNGSAKATPRKPGQVPSLPEIINLNGTDIEIEPMYDELSTMRTDESARTITAEDAYNNNNNHAEHEEDDADEELLRLKLQERPKSRTSAKPASRPGSSAMRKNSATSRPGSAALFQQPLPSLLAAHPSDELKAVADPHSRPSSAALKKPTKPDYRLPSVWNRNWKPEQSMSNGVDAHLVKTDPESVAQFDLALDDLLDEAKIENASRSEKTAAPSRPPTAKATVSPTPPPLPQPPPPPPPISARSVKEKSVDLTTPTPRQTSLFNLSQSPRKVDSSSSLEAGFFTDVSLRKTVTSPAPAPVVERSTSNEWQPVLTNRSARSSAEQRPAITSLKALRKTSIESLTRPPPKRSITIDETHAQLDDFSRPGSSLSSASLPVSIISSKPDLITRPAVERHPKVNPPPAPSTAKKVRVEFPKKSAPPTMAPMVIEGKKVTSASHSARDTDDHLQQSINSSRGKIPSGVQRSQNGLKASANSSVTTITRDENPLREESLTLHDAAVNKSVTRRSTNAERKPTKSRTLEFTIKDGTKWQQASSDSAPSKSLASSGPRRSVRASMARPSTPSNSNNSKLAQQFSTYDVDDGRSSRACQDVFDEESFNQLREELCSELGIASPGWDASLGEHILKNLRATDMPFNEKDLQDSLALLEVKLRESETTQRTQGDDDQSTVQEEIRNL